MDKSDNLAEGIGQVMEALQRQSGLDENEPSNHCDHNLINVHFNLGAAHTLWNIAQTILTTHFGDLNKMDDLGVWRYSDAIGIPPEKVIQKKDFTKMIQLMQLVQDATLIHCLR
ncbi:hypothetical protein PSTG_19665 [Puccinia striiformis f. sp. tritici PST-78]|uniref:DUF6589 domain-containing protein n=1 Tax=Puccinia striiformis f. sp. tritici PST-78 TaxID=1165861 RepID=A0A0L0UJ01_9BASI|nr:hypothetical protein PSTG_19665 [Puccinia striiformis f. sp. tritici PST-78]